MTPAGSPSGLDEEAFEPVGGPLPLERLELTPLGCRRGEPLRPRRVERREEFPVGGVERRQRAGVAHLQGTDGDSEYTHAAMLAPSVFKAYDVRGIVPDELDAEGAYAIACGYVAAFEPKMMAVGRDMRLSSPEIAAGRDQGCGRLRRRCRRPRPDRHRDALLRGRRVRLRGRAPGDRLAQPRRLQRHEDRPPRRAPGRRRHGPRPDQGPRARRSARAGRLARGQVLEARRLRRVPRPGARVHRRRTPCGRSTVVLDGANGMAGPMVAPILERLPVTVHPVQPRARRPLPQPRAEPAARGEPRRSSWGRCSEHGADLGIAWDGDADRCFFIDDTGEFVPGDLITALIARSMLEKHPGLDDRLRPARVVGGARHHRRGRRDGAREPRRARLHQGPHPQGGRRLRRRGLGPLLLPRLLLLRHGRRARARHARAPVASPASRSRSSSRPSASATTSPARSTRRSTTCR